MPGRFEAGWWRGPAYAHVFGPTAWLWCCSRVHMHVPPPSPRVCSAIGAEIFVQAARALRSALGKGKCAAALISYA